MKRENGHVEVVPVLPMRSNVSPKGKVIPLDGLDENHLTPLVRRAGRAPTQAAMIRWFKAMQAAGIPQVWVHYPDGTKLEFRTEAQGTEGDTWADVA
jgi:hypothetical protein